MIKAARGLAFAVLLGALGAAGTTVPAQAQDSSPQSRFDPADTAAIEAIVRDYLLANPEVLIEAIQVFDARQKLAAQEQQRLAVAARQNDLAADPDSPVLGNPEGDVLIVEFFDYRCPYCKRVADDLRETVREDGNIRLVMKEFPILGPESVYAARAALAAHKQGKYEDFHFALMEDKGQLSEESVLAVADSVGLDVKQLRRDMLGSDVDTALRKTFDLAEALDIGGTPAFVIGDEIYPGALSIEALREAVAQVRAESS